MLERTWPVFQISCDSLQLQIHYIYTRVHAGEDLHGLACASISCKSCKFYIKYTIVGEDLHCLACVFNFLLVLRIKYTRVGDLEDCRLVVAKAYVSLKNWASPKH